VVEDVQWADEGSLDLLQHIARTCQDVPLMIICSARPGLFERRPDWGKGIPGFSRLDLQPLCRGDSRRLVETILSKAPDIPQALRELIVGDADGNPFYIEEIIKMLIDQKVIIPGPEQWRIEPIGLAAARVPPTLTGVLQARLDSLTPGERAVLQRASVVGRVFWDSAVEWLGGADPSAAGGAPTETKLGRPEVIAALAELRRKELVLRRESSAFANATEYIFKHELLRNVAYEGLLKKSRRDHHAHVAAWLIAQSGERVNEFTGLIAHHFEHAGQCDHAADWYGRAGQQARLGYAPATAIEFFHKALALLPPPLAAQPAWQAMCLEWYLGLGEVLGAQARFVEAIETCTTLRTMAEATANVVAQARAWNLLAFLHERLARNRASIECAERAELLGREAGQIGRGERVRALLLKGWAFYRLCDAEAVLALGDETFKLCTEFEDRQGMATSLKLHGVAHLQLGHFQDADHFFQQGLTLYQDLGDRRNTAAMFSNLGESARLRGDDTTAVELYQKAIAIVREIGNRDGEAIYVTNLNGARLGLGQFAQVESELRQVLAVIKDPNSCSLSETYGFLGEACLGQGKLAEAYEAARRAVATAQESENVLYLGGAWRTLGRVNAALEKGRPESLSMSAGGALPDPGACFAESLRVFERIGAEAEQARTIRARAEWDLTHARTEQARSELAEARALFLRLGASGEVAKTDSIMGALLHPH
jgi:predicted ATPase